MLIKENSVNPCNNLLSTIMCSTFWPNNNAVTCYLEPGERSQQVHFFISLLSHLVSNMLLPSFEFTSGRINRLRSCFIHDLYRGPTFSLESGLLRREKQNSTLQLMIWRWSTRHNLYTPNLKCEQMITERKCNFLCIWTKSDGPAHTSCCRLYFLRFPITLDSLLNQSCSLTVLAVFIARDNASSIPHWFAHWKNKSSSSLSSSPHYVPLPCPLLIWQSPAS